MIDEKVFDTEHDLVVIRRGLTEHSCQMRLAQVGLHVVRTLLDKKQ